MNRLNETKTCCVFVLNKQGKENEFEAIPYEVHGVSLGIVKTVLDFGLEDFKALESEALRLRVATVLTAFNIHLIGYNDGHATFEIKPVEMKDGSND